MVDKKAVAIVSIIAIIIVGLILGIRIKNLNSYKYQENKEENRTAQNVNKSQSSSESERTSKENVSENNNSDNEVSENEKENSNSENKTENSISNTSSENKIEENNSAENTSSNTSTSKNNSTSKTDSTEKDPEKLAISLAKEKWGKKNSNVYFDVEDKNEKKGIYTIVVRDSNTTVEMTTYKVDVNKKTVTE